MNEDMRVAGIIIPGADDDEVAGIIMDDAELDRSAGDEPPPQDPPH